MREERYIRDADTVLVSGQEVAELRDMFQEKNTTPEEQIRDLENAADRYRLEALREVAQHKEDF